MRENEITHITINMWSDDVLILNLLFSAPLKMAEDSTYWEGGAPPSKVLGPFLSKQSSSTLGVASLLFLAIGCYSCVTNDIFNLPVVKPELVLGANLTPIAWGLHVASWIQKQNGK
mmetsp:Transcript_41822/g.82264  ORF Transcript_41822/g.82264 Transcript_41822/m.82264 type:complete len:116 (-) Transcript_41822:250-597(-)